MKSFNYYSFFTFFGILFLLTLYKIIEVPITHDEFPAIMFYSRFNFWEIMMFPDNIPNNHILNTLLTKCCILIFGKEQWAVRIPNLMSFVIFSIGTFRILKFALKGNSRYFIPAAIIFINPYLLDFFGLCRGYGMSTAILTLSVSYLISGFLLSKNKHIWIALFISILASYANFTLLVFWAAITLMVWFYFFKNSDRKSKTIIKPTVIIGIISLAYLALIANPIYKIHSTDQLQYWTSEGFYKETILSLVHNWRYNSGFLNGIKSHLITIPLFSIIIANCMVIFFQLKKSDYKIASLKQPIFVGTFVLLLTVFINIVQTWILNTPNLTGRTALFFYPLFSTALIGTLSLVSNTKKTVLKTILPIILGAICLLNLAHRFTLKSVKEWAYDQDNLTVINLLKDKYKDEQISLKTSWFFNPSFTFYAETGKTPWIKLYPYNKNIDINTDAEYYYIFAKDYKLLEPKFEVVSKFSLDRWLVKRK